jgi:hypothetical protein
LQYGLGTAHAGFDGDRAEGAIALASSALHAGIPIRHKHLSIFLFKYGLRTNIQADSAIPASLCAKIQRHDILQISQFHRFSRLRNKKAYH